MTRWRLVGCYTVVMGVILSLSGFVCYKAMSHASWLAMERDLESVAGTLHDSIETTLKQPGRLEPNIHQLLPALCLAEAKCIAQRDATRRHTLSAISQGNYYMRLLNTSGRLIALTGQSLEALPVPKAEERWQTLKDGSGNRYRQISLSLHSQGYTPWGYLQVGRSLKELDAQLAELRWILGLGLPIAMGLVGVSSWWLSGLAMQPIRQSYQQMQQFTADAAHELRTPLAVLQASVESTLPMQALPTLEARDTQQIIERQTNRMSQLVKDLLLLCRMDQQALLVQRLPCCLNDLISDLVEEFEDLAFVANVRLTKDVRVSQPLYVTGDVEQLYRLVSNLIVNAIQYTPAEGQVTAILDRSHDDALIHIQDTGIGIAPEDQTRIFERFYRVSGDRSRSTGGSGLGLAIAKSIAQAHHGSLQIKSELGKGSTFTLRLPLGSEVVTRRLNL